MTWNIEEFITMLYVARKQKNNDVTTKVVIM